MGRKTSKVGTVERTQGCPGSISDERIEKLVEMAPRFKALSKVARARGDERKLAQEQQTFLDDFAARLAQGLAESDKALRDAGGRAS